MGFDFLTRIGDLTKWGFNILPYDFEGHKKVILPESCESSATSSLTNDFRVIKHTQDKSLFHRTIT